MLNNITLTSSMRSNLYALKNLSTQMSTTQNRLASGLKVNSAIDNANSYYQARALNNRASDLDMLLDAMGQSIQTISTAVTGLEKAGETLEQAAVIAEAAYEAAIIPEKAWFEAQVGPNGAVVTTAQELKDAVNSGKETICVYGKIDYFENQTLTMKAGQKLVGVGFYGINDSEMDKFSQLNFDGGNIRINYDGVKLSDLSLKFKNTTLGVSVKDNSISLAMHNMDFFAVSKDNGRLLTYGKINMSGENSMYGTGANAFHAITYSTINLDGKLNIVTGDNTWGINSVTINAYNNSEINVKSTWKASSGCNVNLFGNSKMILNSRFGFQAGKLNLYDRSEFTNNNSFEANRNQQINLNSPDAKINITSNNFSSHSSAQSQIINAVKGATIMHQDKIYRAENDIIDYETSESSRAVPNVFSLVSQGNEWTVDDLAWLSEQNSAREWEYNYKSAELVDSEKQYARAMKAFDEMVEESSYQGVNLITGGAMTTMFNESRTHSMVVQGEDMRSSSLGITAREWNTRDDIAASIAEIKNAMGKVRDMVEKLGNNLSIIQTRENFTDAMIDVLQVGADDLVLADMNEESANYLALQTRNNLAVNALSLAAQSGNAVLKLF